MPFQVESPGSIRRRSTKENIMKGFASAIKQWGDVLAERNKIQADIMVNELKARDNFFYKIQEQKAEQENKLKFMREMQQQFGQGNQENGMDMEGSAPQMRIGAGGEPTLHYESPREKEARINLGRKYIKAKQLRYEQTGNERFKPTEKEMAFLEEHPEEIYGKESNEQKIIENKILLGTATNEERQRYKELKEMGRTPKEITPSQALNIISDPFKSQQLKRHYPELYKKIETLAKQEETQAAPEIEQYTPEQEQTIRDNMEAYGRTREEVIQALIKRGLL